MTFFLIIALLVHIAFCILIYLLFSFGKIRLRAAALPFVFLCVLFGPICALFFQIYKLRNGEKADIDVPKFKIENEIYRSLGFKVEEDKEVIPLEEALVLNDAGTRRNLMMDLVKENVIPLEQALTLSSTDVRRKLMMDVLNSNTNAFYDLLEQARLNDDTEVVHYATTAMSELSKKYDVTLEKYEARYSADPDNLTVLVSYCDCMRQYLGLGMLSGKILSVRRERLIQLLSALVEKQPTVENYVEYARQLMLADNFAVADFVIHDMEDRWPSDEQVWCLRLEYFARQNDGEAVHSMVSKAMREHIYFSTKTRDTLVFWLGHDIHEKVSMSYSENS